MDIKKLNDKPNPLQDKIVKNGDQPFKLWLEFEEVSCIEDKENDFANIQVNTLDGRRYAINVWTFAFFQSTRLSNFKDGNNACSSTKQLDTPAFNKEESRIEVLTDIVNPDSLKNSIISGQVVDQYGVPLTEVMLIIDKSRLACVTDTVGNFKF